MSRALWAAVAVGMAAVLAGSAWARDAAAPLPGARAVKVCAAAGPFWPTMTLAIRGHYGWVACKEQSRVVKVDLRSGKTVRSLRLAAPAIAVAAGFSSTWALDSGGTLYRLVNGRLAKRIATGAAAAYNIWTGGGSVWVAADQGAEVVRVSPASNRVVARVSVGDGPADMAFDGGTAWVINHRDRVLTRIDLATNAPKSLGEVGGDAPERMVFLRGSLWVTGRGTKLLEVNGANGDRIRTVDIAIEQVSNHRFAGRQFKRHVAAIIEREFDGLGQFLWRRRPEYPSFQGAGSGRRVVLCIGHRLAGGITRRLSRMSPRSG